MLPLLPGASRWNDAREFTKHTYTKAASVYRSFVMASACMDHETKSLLLLSGMSSTISFTVQVCTAALSAQQLHRGAALRCCSRFVRADRYPSTLDEILVEIFCLMSDPQHFTASCSRIYKISQDPWTRSKYFMQYGNVFTTPYSFRL